MEDSSSHPVKRKFIYEKFEPLRSFAVSGSIDESFCLIGGMDIDEYLNIYLIDCWNKKIRVYTFYGDYITTLVHCPSINSPFSVAIDSIAMRVVVTNLGIDCVVMLRCDGSCPGVVTSEPKLLSWPSGLTIDENGETYIADCQHNRIAIFDGNLKFRRALASEILIKPRDVKIYRNEVYVSNSNKSFHVLVFSKSGELLNSIIPLDADGNLFMAIYPKTGNIILSNANRSEIVEFSPGGEMLQRAYARCRTNGIVLTPAEDIIVGYYDLATVIFFKFS